MDGFDLEASYKRTRAAVDTLIDIEASEPECATESNAARFELLRRAYGYIEKAEEML